MESIFKGIGTALVTPFNEESIDYISFSRLIEFQLTNGVDSLVVCGTTGEASAMTMREKKQAIDFCVRQTRSRVPVIAGTGSNNIISACEMSEYACKAGADALLVVTPFYNKTTEKGLIRWYEEISGCTDKPIIVYNVPSRTGVNITPEMYYSLSSIDRVCAVKEADPNMEKLAETVKLCGDRLDIYSGNDDLLLPVLSLGGSGVISVVSNIVPKKIKKIYSGFMGGEVRAASEEQKELTSLEKLMFAETNPVPLKAALELMGICENRLRLPLTPAKEQTVSLLKKELKKLGVI